MEKPTFKERFSYWFDNRMAGGSAGLIWLLAGGIAYTLGAILYGLGRKIPYMHAVFHLFVIAGSVLQFFCIFFYVI